MIKNIIFDFGDVFINLDKKAPELALKKMGIDALEKDVLDWHNHYEKGLINSKKLTDNYIKRFPQLNAISFQQAWNSILLDFPQERLDWISALAASKKYRLFLLSNTNAMHINQVIKNMTAMRYELFRECFEHFYLSYEIKRSKPDPDIYSHLLKENGLIATETLFIDDMPANTKAAASLGIHTWNLTPGKEDVTQLFRVKKELF